MYLVLLETAANQRYIFDTNKLREHIGASQRTLESATDYVVRAVAALNGKPVATPKLSLDDVREWVNDSNSNPCLGPSSRAEVIIATSGKALVLASDKDTAKKIVENVTEQATREASGLDMIGVIHEFAPAGPAIGHIIAALHAEYETVRGERPRAMSRHPMLPILAACAFSGRPAHTVVSVGSGSDKRPYLASHDCSSKRDPELRKRAARRMASIAYPDDVPHQDAMYKYLHELEDALDNDARWFAVIHADGNGLGQIFLNFASHAGATSPGDYRVYMEKYRAFSSAIDACAGRAFRTALQRFPTDRDSEFEPPKIVPLIVGGDDLTVVCDGAYGLAFVHDYLHYFAEETSNDAAIAPIVAAAANDGQPHGLSACAGIAFVKPHFPFHAAYDLAEALCQSAKQVKKCMKAVDNKPISTSALDFHVLFDSSPIDLAGIRERPILDVTKTSHARLFGGPYVVHTPIGVEMENGTRAWYDAHCYDRLVTAISALSEQDEEGRRCLPNNKVHALRASLFRDRASSDAMIEQLRSIYGDALDGIAPNDSLFVNDGTHHVANLIDAMDVGGFSEGV